MSRFFTSDTHFAHTNVLKYCPNRQFSSIEEMNEGLVDRWNSVVGVEDTVYCIGDFALAFRAVQMFTRRLNGIKHLVLGNHDWAHPAHKKGRRDGGSEHWTQRYLSCGWATVQLTGTLNLKNGQPVRLYHLPYLESSGPGQNHLAHRLEDDGLPLLCGHVHQHWKINWTSAGTPMVNVGVDCWDCAPVGEDQICALLQSEPQAPLSEGSRA